MGYENGKIYKIINYINDEIYVGSTINELRYRWNHHKTRSRDEKYKSKLYLSMREYGNDYFKIVFIENCPCENKQSLLMREEYHRKEKKASLNMVCCFQSEDERKKYYEKYRETNKEYYEKYRETNKEKNKEYEKEYFENNEQKINEKRKEKYTCECGKICTIQHIKRHFKSLKHQNYLKSLEV